jgi:hypothetical protein
MTFDADLASDKLHGSSNRHQRFSTVGSSVNQTSDWTHEQSNNVVVQMKAVQA